MSYRKDVRLAAVTLIDAIPSLTGRTHDSRAARLEQSAMAQPAAVVYTPTQGLAEETDQMGACFKQVQVVLHVELYATAKDGAAVSALLDDLEDAITSTLLNNLAVAVAGTFSVQLDNVEQAPPTDQTGEIQGLLTVQYAVIQSS